VLFQEHFAIGCNMSSTWQKRA